MSWMQKLYETYEANKHRVGDRNESVPLLPILHMYQEAHIEVTLDDKGTFQRARVLLGDRGTIFPCTEESMGRSGKTPIGHPLCDKLQYVAGDFSVYGGIVTSGFAETPSKPFDNYLAALEEWCKSPHSHPWVCAVRTYVKEKCLLRDLVNGKILHVDDRGQLLRKWPSRENKPDIFRIISKQDGAVIRWAVQIPGIPSSELHREPKIWASWVEYYMDKTSKERKPDLCPVLGVKTLPARTHPKKIVNTRDLANAKLISANDDKGFTFRGRFTEAQQACSIGLEVSQKAHSALSWLVARQGYQRGTQTVVAWAPSGQDMPDPCADTDVLFGDTTEKRAEAVAEIIQERGDVGQAFARRLSKVIAGYKAALGPTAGIAVLGMDAATSGRMALTFYREINGAEFLDRLTSWHETYAWFQRLSDGEEGEPRTERAFVGAPSPQKIAEVAYGHRLNDKLCGAVVERLLPCIIDGRYMARDLVERAFRKSLNRFGMRSELRRNGESRRKHEWEWEQTLGVACALFRGFHRERRYSMVLEAERKTRDYLYGRLLAIAEHLESRALYLADENRDTTAERLMHRFADRPFSTWRSIEGALQPYKSRLRAKRPGSLEWLNRLLDEVHDLFDPKDFESDRPLTGEFLLGYHSQRRALREGPASAGQPDDASNEPRS